MTQTTHASPATHSHGSTNAPWVPHPRLQRAAGFFALRERLLAALGVDAA